MSRGGRKYGIEEEEDEERIKESKKTERMKRERK